MEPQKLLVNGVGIQIEDHGDTGVPVVLLHYGGANLRMWDPVIPHLQGACRCIALDLRAHGRSDAPESGHDIDTMAQDVAGVLDGLQIDRAHVVGSSIGAEVGLSLAANHPDRVLSLVAEGALESEYGPYGTHEAASFAEDEETKQAVRERAAQPEAVFESREAYVAERRKLYEEHGLWNPTMEAVIAYGTVEIEGGKVVAAWRKWARDAYIETYHDLRFEEYYERITCPVLMLPSEDDAGDEQCFDIMTRLSQLPRQCEIVVVPGAVHPFGWMLIPEAMANAVFDFIAKLES